MDQPSTILYPIARDQNGAAVHIDRWEHGQAVTCFGCGQDLIGHLPHDGIKPTAHFAHKDDVACSGETALHKATKAALVRAHEKGRLLSVSWECPHCKRCRHETDLRSLVLYEEARPCEGVVSDLLAIDGDGVPRVAIEVVVAHDIEPTTLDRYRSVSLYVFSFRPRWGSVADIVHGRGPFRADLRVGFVDQETCAGCQQLIREKHEWADRARRQKDLQLWAAWIVMWRDVGNEERVRFDVLDRADQAQHAREYARWQAWTRLWHRIAEQIIVTWWINWRGLWTELGLVHSRPYRWTRDWQSMWAQIGTLYATDYARLEVQREKARAEADSRRRSWWAAWLKLWPDIAQRESGLAAAWRPICRWCRQDLTPDHLCPRF